MKFQVSAFKKPTLYYLLFFFLSFLLLFILNNLLVKNKLVIIIYTNALLSGSNYSTSNSYLRDALEGWNAEYSKKKITLISKISRIDLGKDISDFITFDLYGPEYIINDNIEIKTVVESLKKMVTPLVCFTLSKSGETCNQDRLLISIKKTTQLKLSYQELLFLSFYASIIFLIVFYCDLISFLSYKLVKKNLK